ncbi:hypothetical protein LCGC14_2367600 [marine sediment metagenome]|uniref:GapA-binding peptide SR1P n=1 Tax=marine sediment metagenome TaxID=412755 RepID=A0A0F9CS12_9ZZZZ
MAEEKTSQFCCLKCGKTEKRGSGRVTVYYDGTCSECLAKEDKEQ